MKDRQRIGLGILLFVICAILVGSLPEGPGVGFASWVFVISAAFGLVLLIMKEK